MEEIKKDTTREKLLNAARTIIQTEGYETVTVRRVASLAGYTYPILYHYFHNLNSLLWALRIKMIKDMIAELTEPHMKFADPIEEVKYKFKIYTSYFFNHPNVFRFFYFYPFKKPDNDCEYEKLDIRFKDMWNQIFSRFIQEEYVQEKDVSLISKIIIYSLHGMIMLSLSANGNLSQTETECELDKLITHLLKKE